jgi:hypothetical protein
MNQQSILFLSEIRSPFGSQAEPLVSRTETGEVVEPAAGDAWFLQSLL